MREMRCETAAGRRVHEHRQIIEDSRDDGGKARQVGRHVIDGVDHDLGDVGLDGAGFQRADPLSDGIVIGARDNECQQAVEGVDDLVACCRLGGFEPAMLAKYRRLNNHGGGG